MECAVGRSTSCASSFLCLLLRTQSLGGQRSQSLYAYGTRLSPVQLQWQANFCLTVTGIGDRHGEMLHHPCQRLRCQRQYSSAPCQSTYRPPGISFSASSRFFLPIPFPFNWELAKPEAVPVRDFVNGLDWATRLLTTSGRGPILRDIKNFRKHIAPFYLARLPGVYSTVKVAYSFGSTSSEVVNMTRMAKRIRA